MTRIQTAAPGIPPPGIAPRRPAGRARTRLAALAAIAGTLFMTACTDHARNADSAPSPRPGNFPVVEPFALDQAGSRLSVVFELPDARAGEILKPAFIGFRAVNAASDGSDEMMDHAKRLSAYLLESPLPISVRLWRIDGPEEQPVELYDRHRDIQRQETWYEKNPNDVFTHHSAGSTDNSPLIAAGLYEYDKAYYVHEIARISPTTPGKYRLEVENLESHPVLIELKHALPALRYELLVSHYYPR